MAKRSPNLQPQHVGEYIRRDVIPDGMSVTEAAKRVGVGRPALSNLLNGRAALSTDMAVRLEKAFGADSKRLMNVQADIDRKTSRRKEITVRAYVPSFLDIKARHIAAWATDDITARHELAALLRKLVHSTGHRLRHVDFPAHDNAERHGWDGTIDAGEATTRIPEGKSGWEFGTNERPKAKADTDYRNRTKAVSRTERAETVFIFVTPQNWPGKTAWAAAKNATGEWKEVRALDADDLEQWL
ncbi:MAG: HigA family addiction module antitoxin, partial [Vicinamibacterales bacterium]